jgi:predicted nucleic acid-binding protein
MIGLADTSLFIAREPDRPIRGQPPEEMAVSVVTVGELRLGVLIAEDVHSRERRLSTLQFATSLRPVPIDEPVAEAWAGLLARLRAAKLRMPINDSWIAATALAHGMVVVTQNDDFDVVHDLPVVKV